jgi:ribosomal protein S18 acetylase RimI-like enzyme
MLTIRSYVREDQDAVVDLWKCCGLVRPNNDPYKDIARKLKVRPDLFLVGEVNHKLVASAMIGYEGHRAWINYLAVCPDHRKRGYARQLLAEAERRLHGEGCPKINLQVRTTNTEAIQFYKAIGYVQDDVLSFGKRLIPDN